MSWFAVIEGETGELWPTGLLILDTQKTEPEAHAEARRLSALNRKHYRVVMISELVIHCAPHVQLIQGEGTNPMSKQEREDIRADLVKSKKESA